MGDVRESNAEARDDGENETDRVAIVSGALCDENGRNVAENGVQSTPAAGGGVGKRVSHPTVRKYLGVVLCTIEVMFFSGIHYGYPNLLPLLKSDGIFACDTGNTSASDNGTANWDATFANLTNAPGAEIKCDSQEAAFSYVFEIAASIQTCSPLLIGVLFDVVGTRFLKLLGSFMFVLGALLLAFVEANCAALLYIAMPCIGVASVLVMLTNFQIAELFPARRFIVLTLLTGAYDSATVVFWLVRVFQTELNVSRRYSFIFLAACAAACFGVSTFVCLPSYKFDPANYGYELARPAASCAGRRNRRKRQSASHGARTPQHAKVEAETDEKQALNEEMGLRTLNETAGESAQKTNSFWAFGPYLLSRQFWFALFWLFILLVRMFNFFSTINAIVDISVVVEEQRRDLLTAMSFILMCGMGTGPISGLLIDTLRGVMRISAAPDAAERQVDRRWDLQTKVGPTRVRYGDLLAVVPSLAITSLLCVITSICLLVATPAALYASFAFLMLYRSFLFGTLLSFIMIAFPVHVFGIVYGLTFFFTGVASLATVPLLSALIKGYGYTTLAIMFLALSLLSFVHPLQICVAFVIDSCRAKKRQA